MRILGIGGHGANDPGACSSFGIERDKAREGIMKMKALFSNYNDVTFDIYPMERNAYVDVLNGNVQVNFANYDYVFEFHLNSSANSSANGTEIWVTYAEDGITVEQGIVNKVAALGFTNRGVKRENFAVINNAKKRGTSAALFEACFISNREDMNTYNIKFNSICNAIVEGIAEGFGLTKNTVVPIPEEIKKVVYDMKNLVVYGNSVDRRAAEYLADYLQCPTIDGNIPFDYSKIENVYCVGGKPSSFGWTGYADKIITGSDRFNTMIEVLKFINKI